MNWLVVLNLLKKEERSDFLSHSPSGGTSTCVVRATLDDACCEALFFDGEGNVRDKSQYLEIGRQALRALLDPTGSPIDQFRYNVLDNDVTWQKALAIGPSPALSSLIPLQATDPRLNVVVNDVSGDLYDIVWWSESMQTAGRALHDMRAFLSGRDPATLAGDQAFAIRRDALQKLMLGVVGKSKVRFNEPWGMVCLYWAAGSRQSSGKITSPGLTLDRTKGGETVAAAGNA